MKQGFALQFSQNLSLTPALQHAIKLLQMSGAQLQEELQTQVTNNPFLTLEPAPLHTRIAATGELNTVLPTAADTDFNLEQGPQGSYISDSDKDYSYSTYDSTYDIVHDSYRSNAQSSEQGDDNAPLTWVQAHETSLREHLHTQSRLIARSKASAVTLGVLGLLIDALRDDGYFDEDLPALLHTLASHCDVPNDAMLHDAVQAALTLLQALEPCGVGAFTLQHCLQLQLLHIDPPDCVLDATVSTHAAALHIVTEGFDCLTQRDRVALKKRFKLSDVLLGRTLDLIRRLNPRPGHDYAPAATQYAVPEILVIRLDSVWQARLNAAVVPPLRVANTHAKFIKHNRASVAKATMTDTADSAALQDKLLAAKTLVRTVQQHFDTVFRVSQAIVASQQDFFSFGVTKLKPMVLRDIAEILGLHESTVSRVTTKKYLQSPHGVFELKYFFSNGLANGNGDDNSSTAIKAHLQSLIQGESSQNPAYKPLSDQALTDALNAAGFQLARRTVAKYREQLGYPSAHARKPL